MSKKPVIGITLDIEEIGGYSKWSPWYAIRTNYVTAIEKAGGVPILLPHHSELAEDYFPLLDGLIITGGDFDIDPSHYGAKKHPSVTTKPERTAFEMAMLKLALSNNKPVLGICGGEQLVNVVLGGTLIQHIPDILPDSVHQQKHDPKLPTHPIAIAEGTIFRRLIGSADMQVNSTHHQSVDRPGKGVVISAKAPDGIVEAIEYPAHPFCLGVQWHPEYNADPDGKDAKIFASLIKATS